MADLVEITHRELHCPHNINRELAPKDRWYLRYDQSEDGMITEHGNIFEWGRKEFLTDLLRLWKLRVRGTITLSAGEGKYLKYKLTEQGVEEYQGEVVYPRNPERIYTDENDIT